jgi:CBS domain-containing protein
METLSARHLLREKTAVMSNATGREIAYKFATTGYPGLPVVNERMELVGVVTEFDLLKAILEGIVMDSIVAEKIMSRNPTTADIDTPAQKLIEMMIGNHFTVIPIVGNSRFVGVVSRHAIMDAYADPDFYRLFTN